MVEVVEQTVVINNDSKVESVTVSKGGGGYTFGTLDLAASGVPTGTVAPVFDVIIPPNGGHGADIYRELGAHNVLSWQDLRMTLKTQILLLVTNFAQVGIVKNPKNFGSTTNLTLDKTACGICTEISRNWLQ